MRSQQLDQPVLRRQLTGEEPEVEAAAHVPVRDDPLPLQPVLEGSERLLQRPVVRRDDARDRLLGADAEHVAGLGREVRVGAATLDEHVERALLALQVAPVQPHALASVGLDEDRVLHVERRPDLLAGDQEHLLVHVVASALREQRLPEHPGPERVGVEHHLHRDALPRPVAPGLRHSSAVLCVALSTPAIASMPRRMWSRVLDRTSTWNSGPVRS